MASNRATLIQQTVKKIADLDAERKSIGEQIREIKQKTVKGELNMKIGDFNAALRLYNLEGKDRRSYLETLRETFEALGEGDQLDWLAAAE